MNDNELIIGMLQGEKLQSKPVTFFTLSNILLLFALILCAIFPYDIIMSFTFLLINWLCGISLIVLFAQPGLKKVSIVLFTKILVIYFLYAVFCNYIRAENHWEFIRSYDGYKVYVPYAEELFSYSNICNLGHEISTQSKYSFVGSILYLFFGATAVAHWFDGNVHYALQLSLIGISALVPIVVYHMFILYKVDDQTARRHAILFALMTACLTLSSFIVRDMPITLAFFIITYLVQKDFKVSSLVKILLLIGLIASLRLASALFSFVLLWVFCCNFFVNASTGKRLLMLGVFLILTVTFVIYFSSIAGTMETTLSFYQELQQSGDGGTSTIVIFNRLPWGISHAVKAIYDQFAPYPAWRNLIDFSGRPECYNWVNWPEIFVVAFKYFIIFAIVYSFIAIPKKENIIFSGKVFFTFLLSLWFLLLQSSTMGDRRKMGLYLIFFFVGMYNYDKMSVKQRFSVLVWAGLFFLIMQGLGIITISRQWS